MKCEIIRDLLPLSGEGLCSEESEKLIAEHIRECESCRLLYEKIPETETEKLNIPNENETFKKVNHKLRKMSVKMWIIGILLTAVLSCVGYLTFGQVTKMEGTRSFETIAQSFEVRKIAGYIAEGDFDSYIDSISDGFIVDMFDFMNQIEVSKEISQQSLSENFKKAYGNAKVKDISVKTTYGQMYADDSYVAHSTAEIEYKNGKKLCINFVKNVDGKYISSSPAYFYEADDDEKKFYNAVYLANWHEILPLGLTEKLILSESSDMYARRFHKEYEDDVKRGKQEFLDSGFTVTNAYFSRCRCDADKKMFYYEFTMEASDDKGTAIMTARVYYDYMGLYPPEKDSIKIYSDNCTAELENALYNFFG